jgi:hypothetical protein
MVLITTLAARTITDNAGEKNDFAIKDKKMLDKGI